MRVVASHPGVAAKRRNPRLSTGIASRLGNGVDPREGLRDDAIVRGASIATLHRDMTRPCTQGSPAKPGSALGSLPVRPQRASEALGDS
jgi:hypothetical protein